MQGMFPPHALGAGWATCDSTSSSVGQVGIRRVCPFDELGFDKLGLASWDLTTSRIPSITPVHRVGGLGSTPAQVIHQTSQRDERILCLSLIYIKVKQIVIYSCNNYP